MHKVMVILVIWNIIIVCLLSITILLLIFVLIKSQKNSNYDNIDLSKLENNITNALNQDIYKVSLDLTKTISEMKTDVTKTLGDSKVESSNAMIKTQSDIQDQFRNFQVDFEKRIGEAFRDINTSVETKLNAINNKVDERLNAGFDKTTESFNKIAVTVSRIEEAKETMLQLTNEVNELQSILSNNQTRGAFGEYQLNQILANIFGDFQGRMYDIQHEFNVNDCKVRVDAVVYMKPQDLMLCIDSKFPFASYANYTEKRFESETEENKALTLIKNDVKKHIDDISKKYIIPSITLDYALMFVPSDGLLTLLHSKLPQIIEYATEKRVIIVSPTIIIPTLLSCKTMIIDSLKAEKIVELNKVLESLSCDFKTFEEVWNKLNKNLGTVYKQTNQFNIKVRKLTKKFNQLKVSEIEQQRNEDLMFEEIQEEEDE